jgi:hypothetical protein
VFFRDLIVDTEWHWEGQTKKSKIYKFQVLIATYEVCMIESHRLSPIPWEYLIVDEAHRIKVILFFFSLRERLIPLFFFFFLSKESTIETVSNAESIQSLCETASHWNAPSKRNSRIVDTDELFGAQEFRVESPFFLSLFFFFFVCVFCAL